MTTSLTLERALEIATELNKEYLKIKTGIEYDIKITEAQLPTIYNELSQSIFFKDSNQLNELKKYMKGSNAHSIVAKGVCVRVREDASHINGNNLKTLKTNLAALARVIAECQAQIDMELDEPTGTNLSTAGEKYRYWYNKNGDYHRANDKPAIEYENGHKEYFFEGIRYRIVDKNGKVTVTNKNICGLIAVANGTAK